MLEGVDGFLLEHLLLVEACVLPHGVVYAADRRYLLVDDVPIIVLEAEVLEALDTRHIGRTLVPIAQEDEGYESSERGPHYRPQRYDEYMQPTSSSERFFFVTIGLVLFANRSHSPRECSGSDEPPQGRRERSLDGVTFVLVIPRYLNART